MNKPSAKNAALMALGILFIGVIFVYKMNPSLFTGRTPGSFEYVRRGEDAVRKGDLKKAISYFETAFRSSPENKTIKKDLAWAYTKYALTLLEDKSYDQAIAYLTKAYEVGPDTDTAYGLALAYSKKALSRADKADWYGAIENYAAARAVVDGSDTASKNLAISLYNDAVISYKAGKEKVSIMMLKESSLVNQDGRVFEFLGDIYYRATDLDRALFYWTRAKDLDPGNIALAEKLEKLVRETELSGSQDKREFAHFDLRYGKDIEVDAALVNDVLERAYADLGRDTSYYPASKTIVFLYTEKDFREIFKLPAAVRAFYDGNIRMPLPEKTLAGDEMAEYLYHEYTHAVVSALTNNNCPVWFSEGMAMWENLKRDDRPVREMLARYAENREIAIGELDRFFNSGAKDGDAALYYVLAYTAVRFMADNWGIVGLRDILKRLAEGQHIINAIDDEFLLSEKEFTVRWNDYLRKKYLLSAR